MPSRYEIVSEMAAQQARKITASGAGRYMAFLETAANNYKYNFREQLLIHAQKPNATACAEIDTWNRLGRWVNKGTKGIALLVDRSQKYKLRYVFDVSDTNSREGRTVTLWRFQPQYAENVIEALENSFGALEEHTGFVNDLMAIADAVVEDNFSDYAEMLRKVKAGSFLEELDDLNTDVWLKSTLKSGVLFMILTRCGYNARQYFTGDDFGHLFDFNTQDTFSVLGDATSDISEMVLREVEITVRALQKEEKKQNRTFANANRARDNVRTNDERSDEHGTDLSAGGRLSAAQRITPGEPESGQVWDAAARFPQRSQEADLHRDAPEREAEQPLGGDRPAGDGDGRASDLGDGESGERDGEPESIESDALGSEDEQHPESGRGDRADGTHLQLIDMEAAIHGGVAYFHHDAEKQELLRTCNELKEHRVEIAAYFDAHEDRKERGDFIRSFFGNAYVERDLESGQRVGYRAYANCLNLWRGSSYLTREYENFMHWESVADTIYGMMLMEIWLDPDERRLPSEAEQMTLIDEVQAEKSDELAIPQDAIDYVLRGGGIVSGGKFRIYEQFQKGESPEDNIKFLKNEYGTGGHSDAIPGTGFFEDHDGSGIKLWRGGRDEGSYESVLIKWPKIEKRLRQLIAADSYLSKADKEAYPDFVHSREVRQQRGEIAEQFRGIVNDFNDLMDDQGKPDAKLNQYVLGMCAGDFAMGNKRTSARSAKGDFVLPMMREAMQTVMAAETTLTSRCEEMLSELSGPLAMGLEPTEAELNPPPEPKKEYRISLGDAVYLGSKEYEVLSLGENEVKLTDPDYPLFTKEFSRADFDRMVAENPMNDRLLQVVEEPEMSKPAESTAKSAGNDLWQAYSRVKAEHEGAVVLYQVGDFYEVLGEDARTVSEALDIGITTRNVGLKERVLMCGVPVKSGDTPLTMLNDRGLDVVLVDDEGALYPLPSYHKDAPENSHPVGRIDYLGSNGEVGYSIEYTDEKRFVSDMLEDNHVGTPMSVVVYRDKAGNTIPTGFVDQLDPPPQSYKVSDYEQERAETQLARAMKLIDEYCEREFEHGADFSDPAHIGIGYTEIEEEDIPVQIEADLINCRIDRYLGGRLVDHTEYDSIDEFIEAELENLDFGELISFTDEQLDEAKKQLSSRDNPARDRGDEMIRQAMLAAELAEKTGQTVFGFEEGNPLPVNLPEQKEPEKPAEEEIASPPEPVKKRGKVAPEVLYPNIPTEQRHDYHISNDRIGVGTPSERYVHNVEAIRLLKQLEAEERLATPEEQEVLAQYVGWGGLADCFDDRNSHYLELKELLDEDEYTAARESTLTAFYTPPVVIRAMYQALENMGFKSGNMLEPSCGVGNFMGMKPESLTDSRIYGVELDSISGRIARQLYQKSSIAVRGFEKTELPDSFFDVAIGNIPFGNFKLSDKRYDKHGFLIHDYFFAKTLDKVRPGGIIAFVTSKGTMDKESPVVRKYIAQRADLLGAIRLPNNTFKDAAGTEVTSDILFFQKRDTLTAEEPAWVHLNTDVNGLKVNQYFVDNPDMVMGEMKEVSGPFGPETACIAYDGQDLDEVLSEAVSNITGSITEYEFEEASAEEEDKSIPADPTVRNFSYTIVDGAVYYRENSRMYPVDLSMTATSRVKGLIGIRDCVRQLIEYQTEDYPDSMIAAEQGKLNQLYDEFSKKYGIINSRANKSAFGTDNSFFLLSSLEVLDDEGNFVRKADMFSKRTIKQRTEITHVDTASEALAVSLAERAKVDMDYMAELTGKTEEELFEDLKGVVFLNPMYGYGNDSEPKYLPADEYLSGNVREKLSWAQRSAELAPDDYGSNVEALERVQPVDLTAAEIAVRLGSTWVPPDVYEEFMYQLLDTPWYAQRNIRIHFAHFTGEWNVEGKSYDRSNVKAYNTYGTDRINGYKIIEQTLNLKDVRIFDYVEDETGKKVAVLNKKETAIAQAKQEQIKQAFQDWIWRDQGRRERLCKLYNEKFNSIRPREYDGSHLHLYGINPEIELRQHQLNAVARGLYGGNELLGHVVGAGKTFTMVAIAQESKRLGLCHKSLIVVPNHLTEQWASEYLQLYPSANILVATAKDFEAKNRKRFCGRIATGEYDAIIIGHSQLEKIPLSFGRQVFYLEQQRDEIMEGIIEMKENRGDRFSIKQLERSKKMLEAKLEKLNDQSRKDDLVTFEELGIDKLFIDEAHYYKNLAAFTKMRNVGGISQTEAQKSSDLYMKIRYLDELTGGRGVCFATGTPISNTMVEMYTMQKYLQYDTLKRNDLIHFDSWASTFGETVTAIELAPEGTGYRAKTRFAKFFNLPELISMFAEVADIQTADMLKLPVPKANYHSVVLKPSDLQKEMVDELAKRAERVRAGMVNSSQDNMLVITNDGRKLALDQRLINEMLPENDTGKVAACAQNVFEIWQRTADQRSTQMVFCDLSTPHNDGHFNVYDAIRDKLIEKGIPAEEIAYIHSAGTEVKKKEMFGKVRSGQIRVLIGSTQKMGAGTNVQQKLIALHHLDCPWRPADLQQREGRIVRQGNENPEVDIYTYVTEGTFDAYLYQLVESKQKFIGQIMTSKSPVRSAEDIDETALSYAEIKALCSGNPKIKEKMDLDVAVSKLKLLKANHLSQIYSLESDITNHYPKKISEAEQMVEGFQKDIARRDENTQPNEDGFSPMVIEGKEHTEKKSAGSALLEVCKSMTSPDAIPLGQYRGFDMSLFFDTFSKEYRVTLSGALRQTVSLGMDIYGNIQRLDNALDGMEERMKNKESDLARLKEQLETAKVEAQRPFPQEDELKEKQARLNDLNIELNMDKPENEVLDDDRGEDEPEMRGTKEHER